MMNLGLLVNNIGVSGATADAFLNNNAEKLPKLASSGALEGRCLQRPGAASSSPP
jgi:hypothetical protein